MKKLCTIIALLALSPQIFGASLGEGSSSSSKASNSIAWQNWAVAGGALIAAAIGAVVVATNSGSANHTH